MDPLAKLFGSAARVKLLRLFLFNENDAYSAKDAAFRAKVSKAAARKELLALSGIGVLKKRSTKKEMLYTVNQRFAYFEPLRAFLRTSTGVSDSTIGISLKRSGNLRLIVLSGSFTGVPEPKIDLLVVGDRIEERILSAAVHALEAELGRELRYAAFSTEEFRYRLGVYDRLLRDVFDYPHRLVIDKIGL